MWHLLATRPSCRISLPDAHLATNYCNRGSPKHTIVTCSEIFNTSLLRESTFSNISSELHILQSGTKQWHYACQCFFRESTISYPLATTPRLFSSIMDRPQLANSWTVHSHLFESFNLIHPLTNSTRDFFRLL